AEIGGAPDEAQEREREPRAPRNGCTHAKDDPGDILRWYPVGGCGPMTMPRRVVSKSAEMRVFEGGRVLQSVAEHAVEADVREPHQRHAWKEVRGVGRPDEGDHDIDVPAGRE